MAAVGIFLLLCGWRLATTFLVLLDDKRERATFWDESPLAVFHYLLIRPDPNWTDIVPGQFHHVFIELTCYVGPMVVPLAIASLWPRWRWWHTLTLICAVLAIGSVDWYHPSYYLIDWPFFRSAHSVPRWRILALLGVGLSVSSVMARWRRSDSRWIRALPALVVLSIAADFLVLGYQQLPRAFSVPPESRHFPGPSVPEIVNVRDGLGYACAMRGYGVIRGYEPMLSYMRDAPTLRRAREDADYRGEAWTENVSIQPVFWSPNRVLFQVRPGQEVEINQNPGSWWWVNGLQAFPGRRCAELMIPFSARADANGRLELRIHPRGLATGLWLHPLGAALITLACLMAARQTGRPCPPDRR
jgi:hypothetical protein